MKKTKNEELEELARKLDLEIKVKKLEKELSELKKDLDLESKLILETKKPPVKEVNNG